MAQSTIDKPVRFQTVDFTLPSATVAANSMKEWSSVNIAQNGWNPICLTRVTTNRSGLVINGFSLSRTAGTVYLMAKNITDASITADSAAITVLYAK